MAFRISYEEVPEKLKLGKENGVSGGYMKATVGVEQLAIAIQNSEPGRPIPDDEARRIAHHILNFFGYGERIIDNVLEPEDRDVFYTLEDAGILSTEREETTLYDGREWRIHYWIFRKERVLELIKAPQKEKKIVEDDVSAVYYQIPEEAWIRSRNEKEE